MYPRRLPTVTGLPPRAIALGTIVVVVVAAAAAAAAAATKGGSGSAPAASPAAPNGGVIRFLEARVRADPHDVLAQNRLASEYLAALRRTGDLEFLARARRAAEASLRSVPADLNAGGLAALGRVQLGSHEFAAARASAGQLVRLAPDRPSSFALLGDAALELGDRDAAGEAYARMSGLAPDAVDTHARLARFHGLGGADGGDELARRHLRAALGAARALTPPSPDVVAWCHVKLGESCFDAGDWDGAARHYLDALQASPDAYVATEHLGELRAAQRRYDEAITLYQRLVADVPRPELLHALGDVYAAAGRAGDAKAWHDKALAGYLAAADAGGAYYFHHLAGFYADVAKDGAAAVRWAERDLRLRRTAATLDALAWALHAADRPAEAAATMDEALARGGGGRGGAGAHVLHHASLIFFKAGDLAKGKDYLRRAGAANPRFAEFHVHR